MKVKQLLPDEVRARLALSDDDLVGAMLADRRARSTVAGGLVDVRTAPLEMRSEDDGTVTLTGWALTWGTEYDVAGGAPYGWTESVSRGAVTKSLSERDDVRFLFNHDGMTLGRSRGSELDTMLLTADERGLRVDVTVDPERNHIARSLVSAIERGDVDQMSWAFQATRDEWSKDYTHRSINEAKLFDVSAVTYPANPATIIGARSATPIDEARGFPLGLAIAQAAALG